MIGDQPSTWSRRRRRAELPLRGGDLFDFVRELLGH
jgi:hypothetical protein